MRNKSYRLFLILMLLVLGTGLVLSRYSKNRQIMLEQEKLAQVFYTEANCSVPCWYGLVPGKSELTEYQNITETLKSKFSFQFEQKGQDYRGKDYIVYSWASPGNSINFHIGFDYNQVLDLIEFPGIEVQNINSLFTILNEPEYYTAEYEELDDSTAIIALALIYMSEGIVVSFDDLLPQNLRDNCRLDLSGSRMIDISLVEPSSTNEMLYDSYNLASYSSQNSVQPWAGIDQIYVLNCPKKQ